MADARSRTEASREGISLVSVALIGDLPYWLSKLGVISWCFVQPYRGPRAWLSMSAKRVEDVVTGLFMFGSGSGGQHPHAMFGLASGRDAHYSACHARPLQRADEVGG
jgi:hypothetical protein